MGEYSRIIWYRQNDDKGLTFEMSASKFFTVANLRYSQFYNTKLPDFFCWIRFSQRPIVLDSITNLHLGDEPTLPFRIEPALEKAENSRNSVIVFKTSCEQTRGEWGERASKEVTAGSVYK